MCCSASFTTFRSRRDGLVDDRDGRVGGMEVKREGSADKKVEREWG